MLDTGDIITDGTATGRITRIDHTRGRLVIVDAGGVVHNLPIDQLIQIVEVRKPEQAAMVFGLIEQSIAFGAMAVACSTDKKQDMMNMWSFMVAKIIADLADNPEFDAIASKLNGLACIATFGKSIRSTVEAARLVRVAKQNAKNSA